MNKQTFLALLTWRARASLHRGNCRLNPVRLQLMPPRRAVSVAAAVADLAAGSWCHDGKHAFFMNMNDKFLDANGALIGFSPSDTFVLSRKASRSGHPLSP